MMPQNMYPPYGQPSYPQPNAWTPPNPMPQQAPTTMFGKVITNPNEISPQDIPTDGNSCYFPMADKSCIYVKSWNPDCTMSTVRYVPESSVQQPQPQSESDKSASIAAEAAPTQDFTSIMIEHLERIEKAIKDGYRKQVYGGKKNGNPTDSGTE